MGSYDRYNFEDFEGFNVLKNTKTEDLQKINSNEFSTEEITLALYNSLNNQNVNRSEILLNLGADPTLNHSTSLSILAGNFDSPQNNQLLDMILERSSNEMSPSAIDRGMKTAISNQNNSAAFKLLDHVDIEYMQGSMINDIAYTNNSQLMQKVIERFPNTNYDEAFFSACESGSTDMIDILADKVDIQEIGQEGMERAAFFHENDVVSHLHEKHNVQIDANDKELIYTSISTNNLEARDYIFQNSVNAAEYLKDENVLMNIINSDNYDKIVESMGVNVKKPTMQKQSIATTQIHGR